MSLINKFNQIAYIILLITINSTLSFANDDAKYSTLDGDIYSFEDQVSLIRMNTSFITVRKCNVGQFCIEFDKTRISIPSEVILNKIEKDKLFEHRPFTDKKYLQVIEFKKIRLFQQFFEGYLIKTYRESSNELTEIDFNFYSQDKGVMFFSYRTRALNFDSGKFEEIQTPVLLSGEFGLLSKIKK